MNKVHEDKHNGATTTTTTIEMQEDHNKLEKEEKLFIIIVFSVPFDGESDWKVYSILFWCTLGISTRGFCSVQYCHPQDFLFSSSLKEDLHIVSVQKTWDYQARKMSCCFKCFYLCCFAQLLDYMTIIQIW